MRQLSFYDLEFHRLLAEVNATEANPLAGLDEEIDFEWFRPTLEEIWGRKVPRKSKAGRKAWDPVVILKMIVLGEDFNISDEELVQRCRCDVRFRAFLGLGASDPVPGRSTVARYRDDLARAKGDRALNELFLEYVDARGFRAGGAQIVDTTVVPVPVQRNSREENAMVKAGRVPEEWLANLSKLVQKDTDARFTWKNGAHIFGYKNGTNVDAAWKIIRSYIVKPANAHDINFLADVLISGNGEPRLVYADKAFRAKRIEKLLEQLDLESRIHFKAARGRSLTDAEIAENEVRSKIRCLVEHVYGALKNDMGGAAIRTVGLLRSMARIGLRNLVYNMRRLVTLVRQRKAAQPA